MSAVKTKGAEAEAVAKKEARKSDIAKAIAVALATTKPGRRTAAATEAVQAIDGITEEEKTAAVKVIDAIKTKSAQKQLDELVKDYGAGTFILETNSQSWKPIFFWKPIQIMETGQGVSQ